MSSQIAEGPLYKTQRVEFPDGGFYGGSYVELRQERSGHSIQWRIEHGSLRFGHRGTWGRANVREALRTFGYAVEYETRRYERD